MHSSLMGVNFNELHQKKMSLVMKDQLRRKINKRWPGDLRQLCQVLERMMDMTKNIVMNSSLEGYNSNNVILTSKIIT